jgi:hypothetical protein
MVTIISVLTVVKVMTAQLKSVKFQIVIENSSVGCICVKFESKICCAVRLLAEKQRVQW